MLICFSLVILLCYADSQNEMLKAEWPDEYNWKILSDQNDAGINFVEIIPDNENEENWSILGTMMSFKDNGYNMDLLINICKDLAQKQSKTSVLTVIERDDNKKKVLLKIEAENYNNDKNPESQLYLILFGKGTIYLNFIAIKQAKLSDSFESKWTDIFKNFEIVYQ